MIQEICTILVLLGHGLTDNFLSPIIVAAFVTVAMAAVTGVRFVRHLFRSLSKAI